LGTQEGRHEKCSLNGTDRARKKVYDKVGLVKLMGKVDEIDVSSTIQVPTYYDRDGDILDEYLEMLSEEKNIAKKTCPSIRKTFKEEKKNHSTGRLLSKT